MADAAGALREILRELHTGVAQEAAAARIALAVWRRASGDPATAEAAAKQAEERLEALFDALAALEARGKRLLAEAESGFSPEVPPGSRP